MALPDIDQDPLSKSCRIFPPSEHSSKPKPTTRPKIVYKRKDSGCGRMNEKDCLWNVGEENQCPYDPKSHQDCENYVHIYRKCTHVDTASVRICRNEKDRRDREEPRKHVPHIVGRLFDDFCSRECVDKQAILDFEQRSLEEEHARRRRRRRRRSENRTQERNERVRYLSYDMQYQRNRETQRARSDKSSTCDSVSTSSNYSGSSNRYYRYTDAQLEEISRNATRKYRY
ncbi:hypothetical protein H4I96_02301 [Botrytis cinerea]